MRLSIEMTPDQHRQVKASAALQGKTVDEYILDNVLPEFDEMKELRKLVDFLKPRMDAAKRGELSTKTVKEIFEEALQEETEKQ